MAIETHKGKVSENREDGLSVLINRNTNSNLPDSYPPNININIVQLSKRTEEPDHVAPWVIDPAHANPIFFC